MAVNFELIGTPCAQHAAYSIYKAFKYNCGARLSGIISLGDFFYVKPWSEQEIICIGELQLVWRDDSNHVPVASIKLYFLPENTPNGRNLSHGQDEVISISDKVILKVDDLLSWLTVDAAWKGGARGLAGEMCHQPAVLKDVSNSNAQDRSDDVVQTQIHPGCGYTGLIDMREIISHKKAFKSDRVTSAVTVLSYPAYCRYRAALKRYEGCEPEYMQHGLAVALGSRSCPGPNTKIFFCKDTFDCVELENHPFVCNYLAPKWKGRPRKKRKIRSASPGSESLESESSGSCYSKQKDSPYKEDPTNWADRPKVEQLFLQKLHKFMAERGTPIGRLPSLGFKQLDLYEFFVKVQHAGGYDATVSKKMWKAIYIELGGHPSNTSAATCTRKHYEKLLLPYEQLLVLPEEGVSPKKRRKVIGQPEDSIKSEPPIIVESVLPAHEPLGRVDHPRGSESLPRIGDFLNDGGARDQEQPIVPSSSHIPPLKIVIRTDLTPRPIGEIRENGARSEKKSPAVAEESVTSVDPGTQVVTLPKSEPALNDLDRVAANQTKGIQLHSDCGDGVHISLVEKKPSHTKLVATSTARPSVICNIMDNPRQYQITPELDQKSREPPPAAHAQKPLTPLSSLPAELVYDSSTEDGSSPARSNLRDPAAMFAAMEFALRRPPLPLAASPSIFAPTRRIYGDPGCDIKHVKPPPSLDLSSALASPSASSVKKPPPVDSKGKGNGEITPSTPSSAKFSPADVNISLNVKIEGGSNPAPRYASTFKTVKEELKEKSRFNVKENSSRDKVTITPAYPKMVDSLASNSIGPGSNASRASNGVSSSHTALKSSPKTVENPLYPHIVDPNVAAYYSMYSPHLYGHPLAHQAHPFGASAAAAGAGASAAEISAQVYKDLMQRGYSASLAAGMPPLGFGLNLPSLLQAMNSKENSGSDKSFVPKS